MDSMDLYESKRCIGKCLNIDMMTSSQKHQESFRQTWIWDFFSAFNIELQQKKKKLWTFPISPRLTLNIWTRQKSSGNHGKSMAQPLNLEMVEITA